MKHVDITFSASALDMVTLGMNGAQIVEGTLLPVHSNFGRFVTEPITEVTRKVLQKRKHQYIFT